MRSTSLHWALPLAAALVAVPSLAATVTDVADAADGDNVFDANLEVKIEVLRHTALITRENTQIAADDVRKDPRTVRVRELDFERFRVRVKPRLEVGLFHDLSLFLEWPIVLWDQTSTQFTQGTNASNSTISRDMQPGATPTLQGWPETCGSGVNGLQGGCYGYPAQPYTNWRPDPQNGQFQSVRAGFDYPQLGLRWSPLNNERDPTKPTITLQGDYNLGFLPLPVADPTADEATAANPGAVAHGIHEFHFHIGMSKRFGLLDPYFLVDYWFPFAASNAYRGLFPRQRGGFTLGMEIVPFENVETQQKFAIQVSGMALYFSPGRDYSELSDALNELTYTDNFMRTALNLGLYFKPFRYGFLNVVGTAMYDTPHFITSEKLGEDKNQPGEPGHGVVDLGVDGVAPEKIERNVYFNPAIDAPGRRFRVEESLQLQIMAHVGVTF